MALPAKLFQILLEIVCPYKEIVFVTEVVFYSESYTRIKTPSHSYVEGLLANVFSVVAAVMMCCFSQVRLELSSQCVSSVGLPVGSLFRGRTFEKSGVTQNLNSRQSLARQNSKYEKMRIAFFGSCAKGNSHKRSTARRHSAPSFCPVSFNSWCIMDWIPDGLIFFPVSLKPLPVDRIQDGPYFCPESLVRYA
jgi:hypothetical protein